MNNKDIIALLDQLSKTIAQLTPPINDLLSDEITPDQRREFRHLAGPDRVFYLSNRLYHFTQLMKKLCSETARKNIMAREK